jgi:DUF2075 family protein
MINDDYTHTERKRQTEDADDDYNKQLIKNRKYPKTTPGEDGVHMYPEAQQTRSKKDERDR